MNKKTIFLMVLAVFSIIYIAGCSGRQMADSGEDNAATSPAVSFMKPQTNVFDSSVVITTISLQISG